MLPYRVLLYIAACICARPGFAAQLKVHVLDPTQRAVAQESVKVTDSQRQEAFAGLTNRAGQVSIPLPPGRFFLHTKRDGFQEQATAIALEQHDQDVTVR